jgi:hypothetical protein
LRNFILFLFFVISNTDAFAQYSYHRGNKKSYDKYYIGASIGSGTAYWKSHMQNNNLLNKDGSTLIGGSNIDFKAKNPTQFADINVLFPYKKIRYGFGLSFEQFFMDKLVITSQDNVIALLSDKFIFDKMYLQTEIPFFPNCKSPLSISGNVHLGYFGYHGTTRLNFFGGDHLAKSFFTALGVTVDYKLYPHCYVFLMPLYEYKYYRSSVQDYPSSIAHNINTLCISGGIRIDLSKD